MMPESPVRAPMSLSTGPTFFPEPVSLPSPSLSAMILLPGTTSTNAEATNAFHNHYTNSEEFNVDTSPPPQKKRCLSEVFASAKSPPKQSSPQAVMTTETASGNASATQSSSPRENIRVEAVQESSPPSFSPETNCSHQNLHIPYPNDQESIKKILPSSSSPLTSRDDCDRLAQFISVIQNAPKVGDLQPQQSNGEILSKVSTLTSTQASIWNGDCYPRLSVFPKSDTGPYSLGASALAAAMAMSPLFQQQQQILPQQQHCFGDSVSFMRGCSPQMNGSWNPVLAAAAAAFASGRLVSPNLNIPPKLGEDEKLEGEEDDDEDDDGERRSSLSVSPLLPLSGTASSTEGLEAGGDGSGHHWTFQEQFKQLYELSADPKRKEFLDDLFTFMQKRGSPVNRIPIMAKQVLDLYELYRLVVIRGGLVEVINKKLWREITKGLQLPSSITSAAFTLRTQYMKYLYPYECDKLTLSTPPELQAAIDGNRREARRSSYSFEYPMMMTTTPSSISSNCLSNVPPAAHNLFPLPLGTSPGTTNQLPPHLLHATHLPPPLLPPGLLSAPASSGGMGLLPHSAAFQTSNITGFNRFPSMSSADSMASFPLFGFPTTSVFNSAITGVTPPPPFTSASAMHQQVSNYTKSYLMEKERSLYNDLSIFNQRETERAQEKKGCNTNKFSPRCPVTKSGNSPKSSYGPLGDFSCETSMEIDQMTQSNGKPAKQMCSNETISQTSMNGADEMNQGARFTELLKQRIPGFSENDLALSLGQPSSQNGVPLSTSTPNIQNVYRQCTTTKSPPPHLLSLTKEGFSPVEDGKTSTMNDPSGINGNSLISCLKQSIASTLTENSTPVPTDSIDSQHHLRGRDPSNNLLPSVKIGSSQSEMSGAMKIIPNIRISTQAGTQLGLPENTLVVCMEVTGVVYQGVLFGQMKPG